MQITKEELAKHKTADDCWVAVHGKVYNVSSYLSSHPGGFEMLFDVAGTDCTDDFEAFGHSESAATMLKPMYVGDLVDVVTTTTTTAPPAESLVSTEKPMARVQLSYVEMKLTSVEKISFDSANFVFQADDSETSTVLLNLLPGYHIDIRVPTKIDGEESYAVRSYTPIRTDCKSRTLTLLIKRYEKGVVSTFIHSLKLGDKLLMKGPIASFEYDATKYKHIVMIAGGTGIAPMYQICTSTAKNKGEHTTKLILIDANRTEEDILLRKELETLATDLKNRFDLHFLLSKPNPNWQSLTGHINDELVSHCFGHLKDEPPTTFKVLVCGPPGFVSTTIGLLETAGFPKESVHVY